MASAHVRLRPAELGDLLAQIERQYRDFSQRVRWGNAEGTLSLEWRVDPLGHVDGRLHLASPASGWGADAPIRGDQSYLPQIALGLRLRLRSGDAPAPG
jgi:hypothetical protein